MRWAVIGGGMLGMTLARRLRGEGHEVTIIEQAPQLGGLAGTWRLGDIVWDKHYHVILQSDKALLALLEDLGLSDSIQWTETRTGCYADGSLYSVSNTMEFLRFPPLSLVDKVRLGWTMFYGARIDDWQRLEEIPVEVWLTRHSGRRSFEKFWKPLLRSKLGDNYTQASAAFIWAIIKRLYGARRSGMKRETFGYVEGGYARILDRFAETLLAQGVEVVLEGRVETIGEANGRVEVNLADGSLDFDRVIVTAASPIAARLIRGLGDDERSRMEGVTYQGIICASVLTEAPLAGFYVTNITDDDLPFTGVIEMSALVDPSYFGGRTLIYLPRYVTQDDDALGWTDSEVEQRFLTALETMFPSFSRSEVEVFQLSRVRYVLPISTLAYSRRVPGFETTVPGVYAVNSSQILNGTLNVNETVLLAEAALETLREDTSSEATTATERAS